MTPVEKFFTKTAAYRAVKRDREEGSLNHSYLLISQDEEWLRGYMRALAKLIMCEKGGLCGECRFCRLIEKESLSDCEFFPDEGGKITAEGIDLIVSEKCMVKPLEADKRLFVIVGAEKMNATAQNKILKTLEEPPKNVCILLGATGDHALLPTVKSRVKRLEIPLFSATDIYDTLGYKYADKEKLKKVCALCGGKPGSVEGLYADDAVSRAVDECFAILDKMKKSPDIAYYSGKLIKKTREEFVSFLTAMQLVVRDVLLWQEGKDGLIINIERAADIAAAAERFKTGALLSFADAVGEAISACDRNANQTMLADKILFALLEENYRWQKL